MTLTASDVESLTRSLSRWELAEYIFAGLVTLACAGEYIANFSDWLTGGIEDKKKRLEKRSTLLLVAALTFELICLVRTNQISGRIIGSLDEKAKEASAKSEDAINKSGTALCEAGQAERLAATASGVASQAERVAKTASGEAKRVRQQVGTLNTDLADAKQKLGEVVEATNKEIAARTRMQKAVTPRVIGTNGEQNAELNLFSGMVAVISYTEVGDAPTVTEMLEAILRRAQWSILFTPPESPTNPNQAVPKIVGGAHLKIIQSGFLMDGITIIPNQDGVMRPSADASRLLCYVIKDNGVGCSTWRPTHIWPQGAPDDAVWVMVGRNPEIACLEMSNDEHIFSDADFKWLRDNCWEDRKREETISPDDQRDRQAILSRHRKR